MATWKSIEDIQIWHKARSLAKEIHEIGLNNKIDFRLRDQIFGSSGSIMDNIAEGFEIGNNLYFLRYLGYAKGSRGELRSQLYRALDKQLIDESTFQKLNQEIKDISKGIKSLIDYYRNNKSRGFQFQEPPIEYNEPENF